MPAITVCVTYAGNESTAFDREYWTDVHLPLVRECWGPYGLVSAAGFFPAEDGSGFVAICPCVFRDEAAMKAAFGAAETSRVMADVVNFTAVEPEQSVLQPLKDTRHD